MDAPKNVRNDAKSSNPWTLQNLSISVGNVKILKINQSNQKSDSPRMLIITVVLGEKDYVEAPKQNSYSPRMLIITDVFEGF